ncbi:MAG: hypothetical protein HGB28_02555, partial [Oscillochloris sp.]|nr:hypothetical protein [Oscillochloris sp.]
MMNSREFLETSARKTIRTIAFVLFISSMLSVLLTVVTLFIGPSLSGMTIFFNSIAILVGSGLALLMARRPPWQMVLPLIICIVIVECVTALFLPEVKVIVASFLSVVVLLASLSNNRKFTIIVMVIS